MAVALTVLPGADLPTLRRTAYAAVRAQLHPLHGGPGGNARVTVAADALVAAVNAALATAAPGVAALDATRVALRDETGAAVPAITFEAGELADWRIALTLAGGAGSMAEDDRPGEASRYLDYLPAVYREESRHRGGRASSAASCSPSRRS